MSSTQRNGRRRKARASAPRPVPAPRKPKAPPRPNNSRGKYFARTPIGVLGTSPIAKMLLDPCGSKIVYGPSTGTAADGYLIRNNRRQAVHALGTNVVGYFAWFPDYHNGAGAAGSCFLWESTSSGTQPVNTAANPYGSGGPTASVMTDVSYPWVSSGSVASARTLAACIRFFTTAQVSSVSGQLALCSNITPEQLLTGGTSRGPMSVSDLFNMGQLVDRIPLTATELRHAPGTSSSIYRDEGTTNTLVTTDSGNCINIPPITTGASTIATLASNAPGIAIAWSSLNSSLSNDMLFEFVKIIEWMPAPAASVANIQDVQRPRTTWENICDTLSNIAPGWQQGAWDLVNGAIRAHQTGLASSVINMSYGQGLSGLSRAAFRAFG